jgi:hypothetical protein
MERMSASTQSITSLNTRTSPPWQESFKILTGSCFACPAGPCCSRDNTRPAGRSAPHCARLQTPKCRSCGPADCRKVSLSDLLNVFRTKSFGGASIRIVVFVAPLMIEKTDDFFEGMDT